MSTNTKQSNRERRKARVRSKVTGAAGRPRVSVSASLRGMYVQLIDDVAARTLIAGRDKGFSGTKLERARELGVRLAAAAVKAGISRAVLDRGYKQYHGRVKAFADALREGGLTL